MQSFKDKVIVITGASDGLGRQIARDLAKQGAKLALISRTEEKLKKAVEELGERANYYVCDIQNRELVEKTILQIEKDFKTIDILINNAGVFYEGSFAEMSPELIDRQVNTNLLGTMYVTKAVLPIMIGHNRGEILNVLSVASVDPADNWAVYAGTKYGLRGFTDSLKREIAKTNIKVMGVYPAGMDTNIFNAAGQDLPKDYSWMMHVEDVSRVVLFMLSQPDDIVMNRVEVRKIEK